MNVPEFDPLYADIRAGWPEKFDTWQEAQTYLHVERWPRYRTCWPMWTWPHLTDAMVENDEDNLPFHLVYAVLLERSGLPPTARACLHYLARRVNGKDDAIGRRAWPPIDTIADRIGAGRTAVKRALRIAEAAGWVLIVRHKKAPSDYLLDVPEYVECPCHECRAPEPSSEDKRRRSESDPQQSESDPPTVGMRPSDGRNATTHLVHSLGSSLDTEHQRSSSDEVEPWLVPPTKKKTQDYAEIGRRFAERIAQGQLSINDVLASSSGIEDAEDRELFRASLLDAVQGRAA